MRKTKITCIAIAVLCISMASCSTTKMAFNLNRNHIILVQAPQTNKADVQTAIAATATASADASLLTLPAKNTITDANNFGDFQISNHAPAIPVENFTSEQIAAKPSVTKTNQALLLSYDAKSKAIIKTIQFVQKISGKEQVRDAPAPMTMDSHNYLILWIACLGGARLFYIIAIAAVSPVIYLLGGLLSIAALVFFILWILSISNA